MCKFDSSSARSKYLTLFLLSLKFHSVICWDGKVLYATSSRFFPNYYYVWFLPGIRSFVCVSKSQRIFYISSCWTENVVCIYHLVLWSNFNFLHDPPWITFPTQSFLDLNAFCASLRHLLILPFRLFQHIIYNCNLAAYNQFLL